MKPNIENSWLEALSKEFQSDYFSQLKKFLIEEKHRYRIFPPGSDIFAAFNLTPFHQVKVVIIGQDPYHGPHQANGLCFSVNEGIRKPPSLQNIFKELHNDLGIPIPESGNLKNWAMQGVLLLNATLTVRAHQAGSHQNKGWEQFTDAAISSLSERKNNLVFILWGKFAQAKECLIDASKHFIIKSAHPSPFSADRGFFGSKPFSKTNNYLLTYNITPVDWSLNKKTGF
ncbi:MAG: uracil-DNA glycosylase [Bacteroidales bacterium]|nr:uracil-DNA glycosylase [Bacteroidales bacterium]MCF8404030.1 uracil-DNA glycosylase [Bacteroidales bacterium]